MKLSVNLIFQAAALVAQMANQYGALVPQKYQTYVALAVGLCQALVAWKAHTVNPDGTPASVGYVPPSK